jgi:hypothetical protein
MRSRNIVLIILGSALVIVLLAFIGRWTMGLGKEVRNETISVNTHTASSTVQTEPSAPSTGGRSDDDDTHTPTVATSTMITQADAGKTVTLKVGTQFLLNLGGTERWTISIGDTSIVRRVPNASAAKGTQGLFEVLRVGTTTISAEGRPNCSAGMMCAQYIINFKTTVQGV